MSDYNIDSEYRGTGWRIRLSTVLRTHLYNILYSLNLNFDTSVQYPHDASFSKEYI